MANKECTKCIHKEVCVTAKTCGYEVPSCNHFHQGWTSVDDELPTESGCYYVHALAGYYDTYYYSARHKVFNAFDTDDGAKYPISVTHWMPLFKQPADMRGEEE